MKKALIALPVIICLCSVIILSSPELKGTWKAEIEDDYVQMRMRMRGERGFKDDWNFGQTFKKSDFTGLAWGESESFRLVREAGTIEFTGKFDSDRASGTFIFIPNAEFKNYLEKKGFDGVKENKMLTLCLTDVSKQYIEDLFKLGYADISLSKLISFAVHDVTNDFIKDMHVLGYNDISPDKLISFKIHDVTPSYIKDIHSLGYKDISPSELISFRIHDIDKEFIERVQKKWEEKLSPRKIVRLKIHDF